MSLFDLEKAEWRYRVSKTNTDHLVPLASQAVAILREIHALTGTGRFVFPGARSNGRPMSDNAILAAMRRLGIGKDEMSGHGFRAMARTIRHHGAAAVSTVPVNGCANHERTSSRLRTCRISSWLHAQSP